MTNSQLFLCLGGLTFFCFVLRWLSTRSKVAKAFYTPHGPRTDVRYMTRSDLFLSAMWFLVGGMVLLWVFWVGGYLVSRAHSKFDEDPVVMGILLCLFMLMGMGLLGSFYLFLRGLFRSRAYDPVAAWRADLAVGKRVPDYGWDKDAGVVQAGFDQNDPGGGVAPIYSVRDPAR